MPEPTSISPVAIAARRQLRTDLLAALYAERVRRPEGPGLFQRPLSAQLGADPHETAFALAYLAESGLLRESGQRYRITSRGIDAVESNPFEE